MYIVPKILVSERGDSVRGTKADHGRNCLGSEFQVLLCYIFFMLTHSQTHFNLKVSYRHASQGMSRVHPGARRISIFLAALAMVSGACSLVGSHSHAEGSRQSSTNSSKSRSKSNFTPPSADLHSISQPPGSLNVLSYGAKPNSSADSTPAFRKAIAAAELKHGTVYVPPGTYVLDDLHDTACQNTVAQLCIKAPVHLVGAGPESVILVNQIGLKNNDHGLSMPMIVVLTGPKGRPGGADGTSISGMTLNSSDYEAGTDILDFANDTVLGDLDVEAAKSTNHYNPNSFGVRVIAVCNPHDVATIHRMDNLVDNVTITGNGSGGNTELDISCQEGTQIKDVHITGNGMDIYISRNISVEGAVLKGESIPGMQYVPYTWVTNDSTNVTLNDVSAYGSGGVIVQHSDDLPARNVLVENEIMRDPSGILFIGDVNGLTLENDQLANVRIDPRQEAADIRMIHSTLEGTVSCAGKGLITGLVGMSCGQG